MRETLPSSVEIYVDESFATFLEKRYKADNLHIWNRMQSQVSYISWSKRIISKFRYFFDIPVAMLWSGWTLRLSKTGDPLVLLFSSWGPIWIGLQEPLSTRLPGCINSPIEKSSVVCMCSGFCYRYHPGKCSNENLCIITWHLRKPLAELSPNFWISTHYTLPSRNLNKISIISMQREETLPCE